MNAGNVTYFDIFGADHIPYEFEFGKFIGNKNIITKIYRMQAYHSIMHGYFLFRIVFIDFMPNVKSLLEYTNFFSSKEYKNNKKII